MSTRIERRHPGCFIISQTHFLMSTSMVFGTLAPSTADAEVGTVLGIVTSTGQCKPYSAGAVDGSQNAVAILNEFAPASTFARRVAVVGGGDVDVDVDQLIGLDPAATAQLAATQFNIRVRKPQPPARFGYLAPLPTAAAVGTVLGYLAKTGQYVPYSSTATDGSQVAVAILNEFAPASPPTPPSGIPAPDRWVSIISSGDAGMRLNQLIGADSSAIAQLIARQFSFRVQ